MPRAVSPVVHFALLRIERAPSLQRLKQSLLQPESRVHARRHIGGRPDSGQPGGKAAIRPEQFRRLDQRGRRIGRQRADARNQAAGFQQVQISVRGRVAERGIAGQVGLVEQLACPLRGKLHHALKIRQARDVALPPQPATTIHQESSQ